MNREDQPGQACFIRQTDPGKGERVAVHFNPATLQYTIQNTLENKGKGDKKKQYVSQSTAKLTMDLVFDTTDDGRDVRADTEKIAKFMQPENKSPAIVKFDWGAYSFQGMVESYKETVDFFSRDGVPLRASVNLTLSSQDKVFELSDGSRSADTQASLGREPIQVPAPPGKSATQVATEGGDPLAGRALGLANDLDSLRFAAGASLSVGGNVSLKGPVAFASAGAGASAGVGVGISAQAGASLSIGGSASAGVTASAGAFAGLRKPSPVVPSFDVERFSRAQPSLRAATGAGASLGLDGRARVGASASVRADVGADASLVTRIQFEGD